MGYGSSYFKSREAYQFRIYYPSQLSSQLDQHNNTYCRLEKKLEQLYKNHPKSHYKGKPTMAQIRMSRLEDEQNYHDKMRMVTAPKAIEKFFAKAGVEYFN
jgi:hypothetical protein